MENRQKESRNPTTKKQRKSELCRTQSDTRISFWGSDRGRTWRNNCGYKGMSSEVRKESRARRARVLIVENSPVMRKIIGDVFASLPHMQVVGQARDGIEALEAIEHFHPDIVVMDIQMPRMSGLEVLMRIPKDSCRGIMLSAHADPFYVEKCQELHAHHFFDKLADFPRFVELVNSL